MRLGIIALCAGLILGALVLVSKIAQAIDSDSVFKPRKTQEDRQSQQWQQHHAEKKALKEKK